MELMDQKGLVKLIINRMDSRIKSGRYNSLKLGDKYEGVRSRQIVCLIEMLVDLDVISRKNIEYTFSDTGPEQSKPEGK